MSDEGVADDRPERWGEIVANLLIACLVAFFLYGYVPHFLG